MLVNSGSFENDTKEWVEIKSMTNVRSKESRTTR